MNEIYHLLPLQKLQQGAVWVLLTCLILAFGFPVYAQTGEGYISISEPDASQFPLVSFFLEAYDRQGIFIANIQMDEISILEGSTITQPTGIELIQPGLQVVVAVNPGPMLQNHYAGISNFRSEEPICKTGRSTNPLTHRIISAWLPVMALIPPI